MEELDTSFLALTESVIGAAIAVHRAIGPGFHESAYEEALSIELNDAGVHHSRQTEVELRYKSQVIGRSRLDLLVDGRLIVELKAVERLVPIHEAQLLSYLRVCDLRLGLLINFNEQTLVRRIRRVINTKAPLSTLGSPLRPSASSAPLR
jgi:GxxExxY protein